MGEGVLATSFDCNTKPQNQYMANSCILLPYTGANLGFFERGGRT